MTRQEIKAQIATLKRHRRIMTLTNRFLKAGKEDELKLLWTGAQIERLKQPPAGFPSSELLRVAEKIRSLKMKLGEDRP